MKIQFYCQCGHRTDRQPEFNRFPVVEEAFPGIIGDFYGRLATMGSIDCPECDRRLVEVHIDEGGVSILVSCTVAAYDDSNDWRKGYETDDPRSGAGG